jgi:hypothetical protein
MNVHRQQQVARRRVCLIGFTAGGSSGIPRYAAMLAGALDKVAIEFPTLRLRLLTTQRGAAETGVRRMEVEVARGPARRANAGYDHCWQGGLERMLQSWSRVDVVPWWTAATYLSFSGPLQAAYLFYEERVRLSELPSLAPYYIVDARR